jgi:hypothetical protein
MQRYFFFLHALLLLVLSCNSAPDKPFMTEVSLPPSVYYEPGKPVLWRDSFYIHSMYHSEESYLLVINKLGVYALDEATIEQEEPDYRLLLREEEAIHEAWNLGTSMLLLYRDLDIEPRKYLEGEGYSLYMLHGDQVQPFEFYEQSARMILADIVAIGDTFFLEYRNPETGGKFLREYLYQDAQFLFQQDRGGQSIRNFFQPDTAVPDALQSHLDSLGYYQPIELRSFSSVEQRFAPKQITTRIPEKVTVYQAEEKLVSISSKKIHLDDDLIFSIEDAREYIASSVVNFPYILLSVESRRLHLNTDIRMILLNLDALN